MRSYFSEQFADKGRPCSTRKQAYREYTAALLRIGAGGRRVGIQNEGVMRCRETGREEKERVRERTRDRILGVGAPLWDSQRWDEGLQPILYYTTLQ